MEKVKIMIDIDLQEIAQAVKELVIRNAVRNIEEDIYGVRGTYSKHVYVDAIKDAVRDTVKKNADDIINRAVDAGGLYIGKKGLKKMIDEDDL